MNAKGTVDYLWSHGVISDEMRANITKNCKFDGTDGDACDEAVVHDSANTDPYDIYGPVCIVELKGTFYTSRNVREQDRTISSRSNLEYLLSEIYLCDPNCAETGA
jgi:serine carboxypeptidase-like clade 2